MRDVSCPERDRYENLNTLKAFSNLRRVNIADANTATSYANHVFPSVPFVQAVPVGEIDRPLIYSTSTTLPSGEFCSKIVSRSSPRRSVEFSYFDFMCPFVSACQLFIQE